MQSTWLGSGGSGGGNGAQSHPALMSPFIASLEREGQMFKNVTQVPAHIFWIYAHAPHVVQ